jgi:hypothetical protein
MRADSSSIITVIGSVARPACKGGIADDLLELDHQQEDRSLRLVPIGVTRLAVTDAT